MLKTNLLSSFKKNVSILKNRSKTPQIPLGVRDGDRIRFWNNYNLELIKQISIIKSKNE